MFPIRDTVRPGSFPFMNWAIIGGNAFVFVMILTLTRRQQFTLIQSFGLTPHHFTRNWTLESVTIFSSMFLHGGWFHLISNMWALHIFGDNIEDRLGHGRYLVFYLICGVSAALVQVFIAQHSMIPMVGASGAISGISGAYLILFPRARVLTLVPVLFLPLFFEIPAVIYLGLWFMSQLANGVFSLSIAASVGNVGGVAWWAHIGGFVTGIVLVKFFERPRPRRRIGFDQYWS